MCSSYVQRRLQLSDPLRRVTDSSGLYPPACTQLPLGQDTARAAADCRRISPFAASTGGACDSPSCQTPPYPGCLSTGNSTLSILRSQLTSSKMPVVSLFISCHHSTLALVSRPTMQMISLIDIWIPELISLNPDIDKQKIQTER